MSSGSTPTSSNADMLAVAPRLSVLLNNRPNFGRPSCYPQRTCACWPGVRCLLARREAIHPKPLNAVRMSCRIAGLTTFSNYSRMADQRESSLRVIYSMAMAIML